ncbi:hypothetical protein L3Q82_016366 [Scortum barcoo]|uniref:Uncharacterized protein n=1 Tax=Scortum barcoo TaxID=214431 RepID=A0ACB8X7M5_9TELE|nr:hypothetical protein L3Q82_016366 [Scortum barcoo]
MLRADQVLDITVNVGVSPCVLRWMLRFSAKRGGVSGGKRQGQTSKFLKHLPLQPSDTVFKSYTGHRVPMRGMTEVTVQCNDQTAKLSVYVTHKNCPAIMGREWLKKIRLNWQEVKKLSHGSTQLQDILEKHKEVFREELGSMKNITVKLHVKPDSKPVFMKARPVPYAIRPKVEADLDSLVKNGVLEPVTTSKWAMPIVPVPKKDGGIRICGDFKSARFVRGTSGCPLRLASQAPAILSATVPRAGSCQAKASSPSCQAKASPPSCQAKASTCRLQLAACQESLGLLALLACRSHRRSLGLLTHSHRRSLGLLTHCYRRASPATDHSSLGLLTHSHRRSLGLLTHSHSRQVLSRLAQLINGTLGGDLAWRYSQGLGEAAEEDVDSNGSRYPPMSRIPGGGLAG